MAGSSIPELVSALGREEFPRSRLAEELSRQGYCRVSDRIALLANQGVVRRITRDWFVLGTLWRKRNLHLRWLANQLLLPSTLSLEYALGFYGLIPEATGTFTSVTPRRGRGFETSEGSFLYTAIPSKAFPCGRTLASLGEERFFLASPEKALADKVWTERLPTSMDWEVYLAEDLRLDEGFWSSARMEELRRFAAAYGSRKLSSLASFFEKWRGGRPRGR